MDTRVWIRYDDDDDDDHALSWGALQDFKVSVLLLVLFSEVWASLVCFSLFLILSRELLLFLHHVDP